MMGACDVTGGKLLHGSGSVEGKTFRSFMRLVSDLAYRCASIACLNFRGTERGVFLLLTCLEA